MDSVNKRILGATSTSYNGIKFKSRLECSCYKKLEHSGLDFSYEGERVVLLEGFKPGNITIYAPDRKNAGRYGKELNIKDRAIINITYTPDFIVVKGDYKIYFDVKGKENDVYPVKKKMFLKYLEEKNDGLKYIFFEPHSVAQMMQAINIINQL